MTHQVLYSTSSTIGLKSDNPEKWAELFFNNNALIEEYRGYSDLQKKQTNRALEYLSKAIVMLKNQIIANAKTIPYDHFNFLVRDVHRFLKKFVQYDIIFADPPYHIPNIDKLIELCLDRLNPGGVFVLECSKKESIAGYNKISKFGGTNLLYWQV